MVNFEQSGLRVRSRFGAIHREVIVSNDQSKWRELAEKAASEQDPHRLMALVEELTGILSQREGDVSQRRGSTRS